MKQVNDNEALELIEALSHLSPIEFIGLATLLKVPCYEDLEHKVAREADALLGDIIDAYIKMNWLKRKKLLKNLKMAGNK